ncbi:MAG: LysR family transcriptional regulator [Phenylobacterium sp.]|uniref:LysR family transcriptional regulator n=1 Tax=Phenylobacterium sp. TaxID=1871053 RepID=UPI001A5C043F|nr:LysR family transcriptional regulator [Phenylobacterium sp.]MBL8553625.1 LysR family transcriptional regulator [Phenylobacterium sp.]
MARKPPAARALPDAARSDAPGPEALLVQRLRRANLDLLPVLHELLRTRSATATARALGITQPAVSKALRSLRALFDDDLVVSLGRSAHLTERGEAVRAPLAKILADLGLLLEPSEVFDPASERLHVVITTADYVSVLLAPQLARICATEAPHCDFLFVDRPVRSVEDLDGLDFMIAPRPFGRTFGKRVEQLPLWQDEMVCIASGRDRRWGEVVPAGDFRKARQVVYQVGERTSLGRAALVQPTSVLEVSPVCGVPNFLVIGAIVEEAECLALVPRRLAVELARSRDIRILGIDYPDRRLDIDAFWTPRAGAKRGHAWFRSVLARAIERLP